MSWQAISWVLNHSEARLGGRLVMLSIAEHADENGENSWPSMSTIARETLLSVRQVERLIPRLEGTPELEVDHRAKVVAGGHRVNLYRLPLVALPDNMSGGDSERPDKKSVGDPTSTGTTRHPVASDPTSRSGEPPLNPPVEPSRKNKSTNGAERLSDDELRAALAGIVGGPDAERVAAGLMTTLAPGALRTRVARNDQQHIRDLARRLRDQEGGAR
jgi:hypothetical protein